MQGYNMKSGSKTRKCGKSLEEEKIYKYKHKTSHGKAMQENKKYGIQGVQKPSYNTLKNIYIHTRQNHEKKLYSLSFGN